jgi:AcrR family transcriptional regulator
MKAAKSKAKTAKPRRKTDRRVLRTRDTLGDALVALMQEKHFDQITVREVLDRAGVGRSTFYAHYRDKDDLFLSDVEDFLASVSTALKLHEPNGKRLLPVREFFTHVREAREFYMALVRSGKMIDVQALARGFFARSIEERLGAAGGEDRRAAAVCTGVRARGKSVLADGLVGGQRDEARSQRNG